MISGTKAVASKTKQKEPSTKEKILDAAEALFSQKGYYGVSVREVASNAGVQFGLITYHFGTKEELFRQVIARRAEEHLERTRQSLKMAMEANGEKAPHPSLIIRAFFQPHVDEYMRGGPEWRNYLKLCALSMTMYQNEEFLRPFSDTYDPLVREFIDCLRKSIPYISEQRLQWSAYFIEAAMIFLLTDSTLVDRHSDGLCQSSDLDTILEEFVTFFTSGVMALSCVENLHGRI